MIERLKSRPVTVAWTAACAAAAVAYLLGGG